MGPAEARCRGVCGSELTGKFAENPCRRIGCFGKVWKSWKSRNKGCRGLSVERGCGSGWLVGGRERWRRKTLRLRG